MCIDCNELEIPIGPSGIDGDPGENAFTVLTSSYVQPAVNTNVTIAVSDTGSNSTGWCAIGQIIYVQSGGYYQVVSKTATSLTIKYTSSYAAYNVSLTAAFGTVPNSGIVSPGGIIGLSGYTVVSSNVYYGGTPSPAGTYSVSAYGVQLPANSLVQAGDEFEYVMHAKHVAAKNTGTMYIEVSSSDLGALAAESILLDSVNDRSIEIRVTLKVVTATTHNLIYNIALNDNLMNSTSLKTKQTFYTSSYNIANLMNINLQVSASASTAGELVIYSTTLYKKLK